MRYIIGIIIGVLLNAAISYDTANKVVGAVYSIDTQHIIAAYHFGCLSVSTDFKHCKELTEEFAKSVNKVREL